MTTESTAPVVGTLVVPHKPIRSELFVSRARAAMVSVLESASIACTNWKSAIGLPP